MNDAIEIDSFKIRIPFKDVVIIDYSVLSNWILINEATGIIDDAEFKKNSLSFNIDGIKTKFAIERQMLNKISSDLFLIILINSKILKVKYFEGITKDNIRLVYSYLMSLNVAKFSLKTFLNSEITDVDFKRDRIQIYFKESIKELFELVKPTKHKENGARVFNKKNNQGIEFSRRETTSINTAPFLKIYNKEIELKKGSNDSKLFYGKFLFQLKNINELITNRIRCEFTIKNKKHFRIFGINDTSLNFILNIPQKLKKEMLVEILKKHIRFDHLFIEETKIKKILRLRTIDHVLISFCNILLNSEMNIPLAIIIRTVTIKIPNENGVRTKTQKRLYEIFKTYCLDDKRLEIISLNSQQFLSWLIS